MLCHTVVEWNKSTSYATKVKGRTIKEVYTQHAYHAVSYFQDYRYLPHRQTGLAPLTRIGCQCSVRSRALSLVWSCQYMYSYFELPGQTTSFAASLSFCMQCWASRDVVDNRLIRPMLWEGYRPMKYLHHTPQSRPCIWLVSVPENRAKPIRFEILNLLFSNTLLMVL